MFVKKPNGYYVARLSFYVRVMSKDMQKFSVVWLKQFKSGGGFVRNIPEKTEMISEAKVLEYLQTEERLRRASKPVFKVVEPEFILNKCDNGFQGQYKEIHLAVEKKRVSINGVVFNIGPRDMESQITSCLQAFSPQVKGAKELIKIFERGTVGWSTL